MHRRSVSSYVSLRASGGEFFSSLRLCISLKYITKGVELLVLEFEPGKGAGWLSCFIAVVFSFTVYYGMKAGHGSWGPLWARQFILDATFWAAIIWWSGFANIPGNMKDTDLLFLSISKSFFPTAE